MSKWETTKLAANSLTDAAAFLARAELMDALADDAAAMVSVSRMVRGLLAEAERVLADGVSQQ